MSVANFEKHRLSFASRLGKIIFGVHFKTGKKASIQTAAKLLLSDQLNEDGTIDQNKLAYLEDSDLWSYIYYLYSFNNETIPEFMRMKGEDGQASAERFYDVVRSSIENTGLKIQYSIEKIATGDLITFIERIIKKYTDHPRTPLKNPIVQHYNKMLEGHYENYLKNLNVVVRTGRDNARVFTNPKNVAESDIILSIGFKD